MKKRSGLIISFTFLITLLFSASISAACPDYKNKPLTDWRNSLDVLPENEDGLEHYRYWYCHLNKLINFDASNPQLITKKFENTFLNQVTENDRFKLLSEFLNQSSNLSKMAFYPIPIEERAHQIATYLIRIPEDNKEAPDQEFLENIFALLKNIATIYQRRKEYSDVPLVEKDGWRMIAAYDSINWACISKDRKIEGIDISTIRNAKLAFNLIDKTYNDILLLANIRRDNLKCR